MIHWCKKPSLRHLMVHQTCSWLLFSISGNTLVVGASDYGAGGDGPGAAYVFTEPASGWVDITQTAKLTPSDSKARDMFGSSVSISGNTVVVGAPRALWACTFSLSQLPVGKT